MQARTLMGVLVALAACRAGDRAAPVEHSSGSGSAAAPQSAREAMERVCEVEERAQLASVAAEQRTAAAMTWLRAQVTNAEIVHLLDEVALDTWASAKTRLVQAATAQGISACALATSAPASPYPFALPVLAGPSRPWSDAPGIVVSQTAITYAGAPVVALDHGRLASSEHNGLRVTKLASATYAAKQRGERVQIAFDATIPFETAQAVIASLAAGNVAKVALVCEQNHERVLLDVEMPLGTVDATFALVARPNTLKLAQWAQGRVGSPVVEAAIDGGLGQIMRALVERSGSSAAGPPVAVVVVADGTLEVGRVVGLVGAVGSMSTRVVLSPGHP